MQVLTEKQADSFLLELGKKLCILTLCTPQNLPTEKESFFKNKNYNPQFNYKINLTKINQIEAALTSLQIKQESWQWFLLEEMKQKYLVDLNLIRNIGGDISAFKKANQSKYILKDELNDNEIIKLAETELQNHNQQNLQKIYNAQDVKSEFEKKLKSKNINWKIVISEDLIPLLSVKSFQQKIYINARIKLSELQLKRMIIHEIETHLYRSLNGGRLFQIAAIGLQNYEKTGEGLAAYNESLINSSDKSFLKRFYLRYRAIEFGQQNSFYDLFHYLKHDFQLSSDESWMLTLRTKRGIHDTSQKGAFLKDRIYLQGYYALKKLEDRDRINLYKGKFALAHLYSKQFNLNDDNLISPPLYLPDYLIQND